MFKHFSLLFAAVLWLQASPLEQLQHSSNFLKNKPILQNFYSSNNDQPLWLVNGKIKGAKVLKLLRYIQGDPTVDPRSSIAKESNAIKRDLERRHNYQELEQLELRVTSLYYQYLQHAIYGEIDWKSFEEYLNSLKASEINANWVRYPFKFDIITLMSQEDIGRTIQQVRPKLYGYQKLLVALSNLYSVKWQGGWGYLPPSQTLRIGSRGAIVQQLRQRLTLSGDYQGCAVQTVSTRFGNCLSNAVKRFQRRHGLKEDGVVGSGTKNILNISVDEKINKILLNLDRIKWLPRNNGERYIVVNVPEYKLHYMSYQSELKSLKVIVGKPSNPTPIFSDKISYITLNPYWKLPESIVAKEVVPAMVTDPSYIRKQGLEAHTTWDENSSIVLLDNINWSDYLDPMNKFPYRLMQPPSYRNALGKIKFKFPNKFSVYLHDTPTKHLFNRKRRAFSHGCIRLNRPTELLDTLAQNNYSIDLPTAHNTLAGTQKQELHLENKIPINITYLTAWVNANNELIYGDDIYNYDKYQVRKIR